jgi:hypothetical protein
VFGKSRYGLLVVLLLVLPAVASAQTARFFQLTQDVIEDRLLQYKGSDSFSNTEASEPP